MRPVGEMGHSQRLAALRPARSYSRWRAWLRAAARQSRASDRGSLDGACPHRVHGARNARYQLILARPGAPSVSAYGMALALDEIHGVRSAAADGASHLAIA